MAEGKIGFVVRTLAPGSARRVPWKNGLGSTLEIATDAAEPGGEWTWRLSIADVPARAPFSSFPGIDRFLACLEGPGLTVELSGRRIAVPREGPALLFAGEEAATGEPLGPGVRDVNLMIRRDQWEGSLTVLRGGTLALDAPVVIVHVPGGFGEVKVEAEGGVRVLEPGASLIAIGRVSVFVAPGGVAAACALTPLPSRDGKGAAGVC